MGYTSPYREGGTQIIFPRGKVRPIVPIWKLGTIVPIWKVVHNNYCPYRDGGVQLSRYGKWGTIGLVGKVGHNWPNMERDSKLIYTGALENCSQWPVGLTEVRLGLRAALADHLTWLPLLSGSKHLSKIIISVMITDIEFFQYTISMLHYSWKYLCGWERKFREHFDIHAL